VLLVVGKRTAEEIDGPGESAHRGEELASGIAASLTSIIMWAQSPRVLRGSMEATQFPLRGDEPAFRFLIEVIRAGSIRPTELADLLGTGRANVSKITARLEDAGFVHRVTNPSDTRSVFVQLTPSGRAFADDFTSIGERYYQTLLSRWPNADVETLARLLPRLGADLIELASIRSQ